MYNTYLNETNRLPVAFDATAEISAFGVGDGGAGSVASGDAAWQALLASPFHLESLRDGRLPHLVHLSKVSSLVYSCIQGLYADFSEFLASEGV